MKTRVTVLEKDRGISIDTYVTEKEGDEFEKELNEFQGKIARECAVPFRFQDIRKEAVLALLILFIIGSGFSCRSVKKSKTKADSTVSRTVEAASNWATEVITEFIPFQNPLISLESNIPGYPMISGIGSSTAVGTQDQYVLAGRSNPVSQTIDRHTVPGYFRQTVRAIGQSTNKLEENKQATIRQETKEVESGISTNPIVTGFQIGMILGLIAIIIIIGIIKRIS